MIVINILLINKYHYLKGGSERYEFELGKLLSAHQHRIGYFSMQDERNLPSEFAQYFVTNRDYRAGGLAAKLREAGRFVYSREARRRLAGLIESFPPDIAHLHNIYHQLTPSILWELHRRRIPIILTLHDFKLACPSHEFLDRDGRICTKCAGGSLFPVLAGRCGKGGKAAGAMLFVEAAFHRLAGSYRHKVSAFIAPSLFMMEQIIKADIVPRERIHHIPNFVDSEACKAVYEDQGYFLYAGRLARSKGVITLVKAATSIPECRLKIAGIGDEAERIQDYCRESEGRIEMLGYCDQTRLKELMQGARAVIIPSEGFENCPMVVLEAFACGKPVIASAIGGLSELVVSGDTGYLYKPGDIGELREKMQAGMVNVDEFRKMGINARKKVEVFYSPEKHYQAIISLYQQVLGE